MHWLVGIDEAGYGPNLGPLVQAAVAIGLDDPDECLWTKYAAAIRRATDPDDGRIAIDDSKLIHVGPNKFERLEANLLQSLNLPPAMDGIAIGDSVPDLKSEAWYANGSLQRLESASNRNSDSQRNSIAVTKGQPILSVSLTRSVITPAPRFNQLIDIHGTKAAPLAIGVVALMRAMYAELSQHPMTFVIDKQGGRNFYAPMISTAFPDSWVRVLGEAGSCSNYELDGLERTVRLTFRPKAERHCLPVALASMVAKYLRERLMQQFNHFWQQHVPELEPTAGYSVDARRYYVAILPAMKRLGMRPDIVWRKK
jgi:ribonuclease HII